LVQSTVKDIVILHHLCHITIELYGGQDWTALCLVLAEQRHVEAIKLPYGEDVLDNFYLHENVDRFFDIFGSRGGDEEHANAQEALV